MVSRWPESRRERAVVLCLVLWGDRNYTVWKRAAASVFQQSFEWSKFYFSGHSPMLKAPRWRAVGSWEAPSGGRTPVLVLSSVTLPLQHAGWDSGWSLGETMSGS